MVITRINILDYSNILRISSVHIKPGTREKYDDF